MHQATTSNYIKINLDRCTRFNMNSPKMGKRKPKEPKATSGTPNDVVDFAAPPPPTSSVFNSLFGDVQPQNDAVFSLFSDNNPFKRKPQQSTEIQRGDAVDGNPHFVELKKSKRNKGHRERSNLDDLGSLQVDEEEATETPLVSKEKSKKQLKRRNGNKGFEENFKGGLETEKSKNNDLDFQENSKLGDESIPVLKKDKRMEPVSDFDENRLLNKKKRKRDDVEREYEQRMYGGKVAAEEEEGKEESGNVVGKKRKKVDDAGDSMVPKEGFDDESKLLRTVFIGNLPVKVKKKLLLKEFSKFGEIESVRIRSVPLMDVSVL